jgi:tetratricopeptide (TPR) repeat protein
MMAGIIFSCGKDPGVEALRAYESGDYSLAIRLFEQARQQSQNDTLFQEKLALAYLFRGKELYAKTRNIESFSGNYEKAKKHIPDRHSETFKGTYSELLVELARAYTVAKPETEMDEETFFNNSVEIVKMAIAEDSTNQAAHKLLADIKQDHFQGLLDRAKNLYQRAGRTADPDLYFVSEYVFKQARELDPANEEIDKYLRLILRKTLGVLNYREGVALAVTGFDRGRGRFSVNVAVKNYLQNPLHMKLENFRLVDGNGTSYPLDPKAMKQNELLGRQVLADRQLDEEDPLAEGNLVFTVPDTVDIHHIAYLYQNTKTTKRYFP